MESDSKIISGVFIGYWSVGTDPRRGHRGILYIWGEAICHGHSGWESKDAPCTEKKRIPRREPGVLLPLSLPNLAMEFFHERLGCAGQALNDQGRSSFAGDPAKGKAGSNTGGDASSTEGAYGIGGRAEHP